MTDYKKYENYKKTNIDYIEFIPSHWEQTQIKAVTRTSVIKKKPTEELLSVYREYGVIPKNSRNDNHNADGKDLSTYKYVSKNNLVVNKMKAWQGSMGVSNYSGIVSPAYIVCKLTDNIVPKYVHYLLRSKHYIDYYNRISYGVRVGQWDMRYGDFKNLPFFIPQIDEQDKIVSFIEYKEKQINKLIKKQKKLIELLEEKKKIIITEAVTKGLDKSVPMKDSGIDYIGQIPQNWKIQKLKTVSRIKGRIGFRGYTALDIVDKSHKGYAVVIGGTNIMKDGYISYDKITLLSEFKYLESPEIMLKGGEILITKVGAGTGENAIYDFYYDRVTINPNVMICDVKDKELSYFINYYLLNKKIKEHIKVESLKSGAQPAINQSFIKALYVLIPTKNEINAIIKYIKINEENINRLIAIKKDLIEKLEEYKKSLISFAVTGQIDVRDYEIPKIDDDIDLENIENISEDDTETISEVEYANN